MKEENNQNERKGDLKAEKDEKRKKTERRKLE